MSTHSSSAPERQATPHATNSTTNNTISDAVKRRAQSLINDRTIDESDRAFIRYALATNDTSGLSELVRRVDAGEPVIESHACWKPMMRFQPRKNLNGSQR